MITVIVYFKLTDGITYKEIISKFEQTTQKWRDNQDLLRKNYLIDLEIVYELYAQRNSLERR